jgi:hypothetical protein
MKACLRELIVGVTKSPPQSGCPWRPSTECAIALHSIATLADLAPHSLSCSMLVLAWMPSRAQSPACRVTPASLFYLHLISFLQSP